MMAHFALTFVMILAITFSTTWFLEQPFLKLRDRWFPSRIKSRGPVVPPVPLTALLVEPVR